jgi:hypothetical protein
VEQNGRNTTMGRGGWWFYIVLGLVRVRASLCGPAELVEHVLNLHLTILAMHNLIFGGTHSSNTNHIGKQ